RGDARPPGRQQSTPGASTRRSGVSTERTLSTSIQGTVVALTLQYATGYAFPRFQVMSPSAPGSA
ncbi:hypothetical protein, partial [Mammaliicoccus sciuri]|uniref:hypothetical protein n=1 Tax=Mammaliicoccus sciuri TaxID=1296 RepID=UPI0031FE9574